MFTIRNGLITFCTLFLCSLAYTQSPDDPHASLASTFTQKYLVQQLTIENGLSDNDVNVLLQDCKGFIWIGTNDGLNRFDGYQFKKFKYKPGDRSSISHNRIFDLLQTQDGTIWIATEEGLNRFNPLTESFDRFRHDPANGQTLGDDHTEAIFEDNDGVLWVGTLEGLNRFDEKNETFTLYRHDVPCDFWDCYHPNRVSAIGETKTGQLIVGFWGMGIMLFDKKTHEFQKIEAQDISLYKVHDWVNDILPTQHNDLIIATDQNLFVLDTLNELTSIFLDDTSIQASSCRITQSGKLLVGTLQNGLYIMDESGQIVDNFLPEAENIISLNHNSVGALLEDKAGDIWLGTNGQGLFRLNPKGSQFRQYLSPPKEGSILSPNHIKALLEVKEDVIWVGTSNHGINIFDRSTEHFRPLELQLRNPTMNLTNSIVSFLQDSDQNIWIGSFGRGLIYYQPATRQYRQYIADFNDSTKLPDHYIFDILETDNKEIWIATPKGIAVLQDQEAIQNEEFRQYKHDANDSISLVDNYVNCLFQTEAGQIWVGTSGGLQLFDREKETFQLYQHDPEDINTISNNFVLSIFEDRQGQLWVGTRGGLNKFDSQSDSFIHCMRKDGLLDSYVTDIREDQNGFLWLGTKNGVSQFDPNTGDFKDYDAKDGFFNYNIEAGALMISQYSGSIYAGGENGITFFHPDSIQENSFIPSTVITALKKYSVQGQEINEIMVKGVEYRDKVILTYHDNIINLELAALNYQNPEKNQYAYKLEGFNDDWINIGTKREITFTNLDPGNYTLHVKGSNNDGIWNEAATKLVIKVLPPWWKTTWAYLSYGLLILLILLAIYYVLLRRQQLHHQLTLEKEEAERLKELDSFKSRLYTNLTHEFRTPLTVILGLSEEAEAKPDLVHKTGFWDTIKRNAGNLLHLVNQLLDLSRLENKSMPMHYSRGNLILFLRYTVESFQSFANSRNISLTFRTTLQEFVTDYDEDKLTKIIGNLLSNAIKFTPSGGNVSLKISEPASILQIEIKDTGIGIPEDQLPRIFDRFYQLDNTTTRAEEGTGIGLTLSRELVHLLGGSIKVESKVGEGTTFTLHLPFEQKEPLESHEPEKVQPKEDKKMFPSAPLSSSTTLGVFNSPKMAGGTDVLPLLLIVEDNSDVVEYLRLCLSPYYALDFAYNGKAGLEKAAEIIPDLIISDVMMPIMDGYQMCDQLKQDEKTSHIPIILLTAKATVGDRISGLKKGADAYLSKPFNKEELLVRVEKLLELRKQLQARYRQLEVPDITQENVLEDAFLIKVRKIIQDNLSDNQFSIDQLCREVAMSRMQLHRKLKALTDRSASNFIRIIRLQKSRELLLNSELTISEVAYEVGFNDPKYFSRVFAEEFGKPPSDFRQA